MFLVPVTIYCFYCKNTTSLFNSCRITCTLMVSIFFCSFVAVYDCKFYNHLVIVTYFTGLFVFDRSFKSQTRKSGATCEISTMEISSFILHLHVTTRCFGVSKKDRLEWVEVVWIFYFSGNVHLNVICCLFRREDSTVSWSSLRRLLICTKI